jgi:hypothetical protein
MDSFKWVVITVVGFYFAAGTAEAVTNSVQSSKTERAKTELETAKTQLAMASTNLEAARPDPIPPQTHPAPPDPSSAS